MEEYLIYLRKSRADRDAEARGEGDTLARHRTALLELARRMELFIAGIYEEVVSGESIAARPEMQKLLRDVETGRYAGVLVMEVERLARGNTRDQGIVAETFQYSATRIITPSRIYDPEDEADQEYFEFGLFMSRREYKTINRRLQRGRAASISEGKYIAGSAPYGYVRVKLPRQKGFTLEIVPDKAEVVRHIFSLYVNGERRPDGSVKQYGSFTIAKILDTEGVPSPGGGKWQPCTVKDMIANPTYTGMLRWSYRPTVRQIQDGRVVTVRPVNHNMTFTPGIHPPIVDRATWDAAQSILSQRTHAPLPGNRKMVNPLAGLVYCSACGRSMERRKFRHGRDMLGCPNKNCASMASVLEDVECGILDALRCWLAEYKIGSVPAPSFDEAAAAIRAQEHVVARLASALSTLQTQRDSLFDLLEQGVYTTEVFGERIQVLAAKTAETESALAEASRQLQVEQSLADSQLLVIPRIERVLEQYHQLELPQEKNDLLKKVLQKILYTKTTGGRWVPSDMRLAVFPKVK